MHCHSTKMGHDNITIVIVVVGALRLWNQVGDDAISQCWGHWTSSQTRIDIFACLHFRLPVLTFFFILCSSNRSGNEHFFPLRTLANTYCVFSVTPAYAVITFYVLCSVRFLAPPQLGYLSILFTRPGEYTLKEKMFVYIVCSQNSKHY